MDYRWSRDIPGIVRGGAGTDQEWIRGGAGTDQEWIRGGARTVRNGLEVDQGKNKGGSGMD